jgi:hypothetical protein
MADDERPNKPLSKDEEEQAKREAEERALNDELAQMAHDLKGVIKEIDEEGARAPQTASAAPEEPQLDESASDEPQAPKAEESASAEAATSQEQPPAEATKAEAESEAQSGSGSEEAPGTEEPVVEEIAAPEESAAPEGPVEPAVPEEPAAEQTQAAEPAVAPPAAAETPPPPKPDTQAAPLGDKVSASFFSSDTDVTDLFEELYGAPEYTEHLSELRSLDLTDVQRTAGMEWLLKYRYPYALIYDGGQLGNIPGDFVERTKARTGFNVVRYEHAIAVGAGECTFNDDVNALFIRTIKELLLEQVAFLPWEYVDAFGYQANQRVEAVTWALGSFYGLPVRDKFPCEQAYRLFKSLMDGEQAKKARGQVPTLEG